MSYYPDGCTAAQIDAQFASQRDDELHDRAHPIVARLMRMTGGANYRQLMAAMIEKLVKREGEQA